MCTRKVKHYEHFHQSEGINYIFCIMFSLFFALGFTVPLESFYSAVFCVSIPMAAIMVAFLKWSSKNVVLIQHLHVLIA